MSFTYSLFFYLYIICRKKLKEDIFMCNSSILLILNPVVRKEIQSVCAVCTGYVPGIYALLKIQNIYAGY